MQSHSSTYYTKNQGFFYAICRKDTSDVSLVSFASLILIINNYQYY